MAWREVPSVASLGFICVNLLVALFHFETPFLLQTGSIEGYDYNHSELARELHFPEGGHMNMIGEFANRVSGGLSLVLDWALNHWTTTMILLVMMIYGAGKQRRLHHQHRQ